MNKKSVYAVFLCLFLTTCLHAKVYDCFLFFNEIELLKMRLEELNDVVDHFVLVESIETQRGDLKPLYFQQNQHLFEKYLPKIIHVIVDERHPKMGFWERENFQRNCITRGLNNCDHSDLILISDLDEIPRIEPIKQLSQTLFKVSHKLIKKGKNRTFKKKKKKQTKEEKMFYLKAARAFEMPLYFYHLNRCSSNPSPWVGTVATTYEVLKKFSPQHFREYRWKFPKLLNAGWHFSWMGGKEKIRTKLCSVVEGNPNGESLSDEELDNWINCYPVIAIDETFPRYVQEHQEYLKSIGFIANIETD